MMRSKAFTLIELLVVVGIIGILATIAVTQMSTSRMKGRDTKRIADLRAIASALELYYNDNGAYPPSSCGYDCNGYYASSGWGAFATAMLPYMSKLPVDPINNGAQPWNANGYTYYYGNVGHVTYKDQYDLVAQLEDPANPLRCAVKQYKYFFDGSMGSWCGTYSGQLIDMSPF